MVPAWIREVAKALAAALSTFAAALTAGGVTGGLDGAGTAVAVIGGLAAGLLTFAIPNTPPTGARRAGADDLL